MPGVRPLSQAPMVSLAIQRGSAAFSSPRAPGSSLRLQELANAVNGWPPPRESRADGMNGDVTCQTPFHLGDGRRRPPEGGKVVTASCLGKGSAGYVDPKRP